MIPFQLSPVDTRNSVNQAIPKLANDAWRPRPWQGWSSSQTLSQKVKTKISYLMNLPMVPKSSTPNAAKMKNSNKKRRPKFPTWGRAWATVSNNLRTPLAVLSSLRTRAIRRTRITRIMDILIGIVTTPFYWNCFYVNISNILTLTSPHFKTLEDNTNYG